MNSTPRLLTGPGPAPTENATSGMNVFHWLLALGFPLEVAASTALPAVFAAENCITANDRALSAERTGFSDPTIPAVRF